MYLVSCTNTHRDVTDLVNHGMVKNTKAWISWEQNIFFLQNKRILNLCFRWHILRSYCFVAEVTFKLLSWNSGLQSNTTCILSALWVWCRWWWGIYQELQACIPVDSEPYPLSKRLSKIIYMKLLILVIFFFRHCNLLSANHLLFVKSTWEFLNGSGSW